MTLYYKSGVYEDVKWELEENCLFTVNNRIYKQIRGVAIGGALSAQLSCLPARCHGRFAVLEFLFIHVHVLLMRVGVPTPHTRVRNSGFGRPIGHDPGQGQN